MNAIVHTTPDSFIYRQMPKIRPRHESLRQMDSLVHQAVPSIAFLVLVLESKEIRVNGVGR
jgi:hypothetical protein